MLLSYTSKHIVLLGDPTKKETMITETIKNHIKDFISHNSRMQSESKGKILHKTNKVELVSFDTKKEEWLFEVEGTSLYDVKIFKITKNRMRTSCNCRYDWGGPCKHVIASLLYIYDDKQAVPEKGKTSRTRFGFRLKEYKNITTDIIFNNINDSTESDLSLSDYTRIKKADIKDDIIHFEIKHFGAFADVYIKMIEGEVYIEQKNKKQKFMLSHAEAFCLLSIADSASPNFIDIVFSDKIKDLEKQILADFGLNSKFNFNKYFCFTFHPENGLVYSKTENANGLLPIGDNSCDFVKKIINNFDTELAIDNNIKIREERELGFYLEHLEDYRGTCTLNIVPITGKLNKQKTLMATHFKEYYGADSDYSINVSENANKILSIIDQLEDSFEEDDETLALHSLAMKALIKEKFVFRHTKPGERLRKSELEPINISSELFDININVKSDKQFNIIEAQIRIEDILVPAEELDLKLKSSIVLKGNNYYLARNTKVSKLLESLKSPVRMVKKHKKTFFMDVIKPLARYSKLTFSDSEFDVETVELDFNKKQIFLSEKDQFLIIKPQVEYQQGTSIALNSTGDIIEEKDGKLIQYIRNIELEQDFIDSIAALHPNFTYQKDDKIFYLHYNEFTENMWFYKFFDALTLNEIEVFGLKNLKNFKYSPHKGQVNTSISSKQDWFEIKMEVSFGDIKVKLKDIRKAILNKEKYVQLKNGSVGILPTEWFSRFEKQFRHGEIDKETIKISKLKFTIIDELFEQIDDSKVLAELAEKQKRLANFTHIEDTKVPEAITAELRPYQKEGFNWLNFLHEMNWGGILADDMGLGKTLQILTFLQHILATESKTNLIVLPTSLLFNWENEIEKFAPSLKSFCHYGTSREKSTVNFDSYDIIFTTYGVLLRDIEILKDYEFNYVILDESQSIKNPSSRRFKAAMLLKSKNRLALSGTPIENSTFDLFAQMNFVNPGFLGNINSFKKDFSNAIDKDGNEKVAAELQRLINPFVLRRTKEKVASELPSKTEGIIYCQMGSQQREVYDAYRNKFRDQLMGNIAENGLGKSKLMVLEGLMRLRQICDSPVLLKDKRIDTTDSVKITELIQHITDKTANHKILVFSQFTSMLGLIKTELSKRNISFEYLDGKSSRINRQKSVDKFQDDDQIRVFLISLKAGGTGLNLTAADYVYIVDPWWNPAVENQAIDRCYRIGQEKKVFAYKMICKDTIEEKILILQNKKQKLANDIVSTDENIMKNLSVDDISDLFK